MVALWPSLRTVLSVARPKTLATLNVLTFNVFCGPPTPTALCGALEGSKRLRLQAERIRDLAPDIVCLQEVQSDGVRQAFERMLPEYDSHYILTVCHGTYESNRAGILLFESRLAPGRTTSCAAASAR